MQNQKDMQSRFATLAQRIGASTQDLEDGAKTGDFSKVLAGLTPADAEKVRKVLNNRQAAEKLLSTPQAQQLLQRLQGR